jgi:hypothetical protein
MQSAFSCPRCGQNYEVSFDVTGKRTTCAKCGQPMVFPKETPTPAPIAQVAESPSAALSRFGKGAIAFALGTTLIGAIVLVAVISSAGKRDDMRDQSRRADNGAGNESNQSRRAEVTLRGHGVAAETREERIVAEYILDHADDPDPVEFVEWGPHALAKDPADREFFSAMKYLSDLLKNKDSHKERLEKIDALVRVRFRCRQAKTTGKAQYDEVWYVMDGKVTKPERLWSRDLNIGGLGLGLMLKLFMQSQGEKGHPPSGIPGGVPCVGSEWKQIAINAIQEIQEQIARVKALEGKVFTTGMDLENERKSLEEAMQQAKEAKDELRQREIQRRLEEIDRLEAQDKARQKDKQ